MSEDKYFTPEEIAEKYKVSKATVYNWIQKGKLKAIRLGKSVRIPESALNDFIQKTGS